jgi:hypothetical protein
MILLTVVLALITPLLMLFLVKRAVIRPMAMAVPVVGPAAQQSVSNQRLLASLPQSMQQPWIWQELDRRLLLGAVSNSEAAGAIDCLIADLNKRAQPEPLTWSDQFVTHAITRGFISAPQYSRLAQAFNGTPKLRMAAKVREGKRLAFTIEYGSPWLLPGMVLLKSLQQVKLSDGAEIQTAALTDPNNGRGIPNPDYLSAIAAQNISGNLKLDLSPGKYTANFILDAGEWVQNGAPGIGNEPGQPVHWPAPVRTRWTEQIAVPFEVLPADQSPVALVTDSTLDPQTNGKIMVTNLRAIHFGTGSQIIVQLSLDATSLPYCFDVAVRISGEEHRVATVFAPGGKVIWNGQCNLTSLSPDVKSIDLVLRPDPDKAGDAIGMDRIWGGTIDLWNQPLQRYDLQNQQPSQ